MKTIGNNEYKGVISSLFQMVKIEGVRGLFKGNGTNVIRIAPYSAIQFSSYEKYKTEFLAMNPKQTHLTPVQNLLAGGLAGVTSLLCTYPLDLIRSRLTIQTTEEKYKGIFAAFKTVCH
jgi:solute carrier family 25 phosphate transporter 23/24/25/41